MGRCKESKGAAGELKTKASIRTIRAGPTWEALRSLSAERTESRPGKAVCQSTIFRTVLFKDAPKDERTQKYFYLRSSSERPGCGTGSWRRIDKPRKDKGTGDVSDRRKACDFFVKQERATPQLPDSRLHPSSPIPPESRRPLRRLLTLA